MISAEQVDRLRRRLEVRRHELFEARAQLDRSWQDLHEPAVEVEERAQMEKLSYGHDKLDAQEKDEIERIDDALARVHVGTYGLCVSCGADIEPRRLEAVPWTDLCAECARDLDEASDELEPRRVAVEERDMISGENLPPDLDGMSDEELQDAIMTKLVEDGRVELDELEVTVTDGSVALAGALPSLAARHLLHEILQDTLGLVDVRDEIRVEPVLWEREDRAPGREPSPRTDEEAILEGDVTEEDVYETMKSGESLAPPDEFTPEKELNEDEQGMEENKNHRKM